MNIHWLDTIFSAVSEFSPSALAIKITAIAFSIVALISAFAWHDHRIRSEAEAACKNTIVQATVAAEKIEIETEAWVKSQVDLTDEEWSKRLEAHRSIVVMLEARLKAVKPVPAWDDETTEIVRAAAKSTGGK